MSSGFTHQTADTTRDYRDEWYTPPWLFEALGNPEFDIDPFSPVDRTLCSVRARTYLTPEDNGLVTKWGDGKFAWVNSPYGRAMNAAVRAFVRHKGPALFLCFASTETAWGQQLLGYPVLFLNRRVAFVDGRIMVEEKIGKKSTGRMIPNPGYGQLGDASPKGSMIVAKTTREADWKCLMQAAFSGFGRVTTNVNGPHDYL